MALFGEPVNQRGQGARGVRHGNLVRHVPGVMEARRGGQVPVEERREPPSRQAAAPRVPVQVQRRDEVLDRRLGNHAAGAAAARRVNRSSARETIRAVGKKAHGRAPEGGTWSGQYVWEYSTPVLRSTYSASGSHSSLLAGGRPGSCGTRSRRGG